MHLLIFNLKFWIIRTLLFHKEERSKMKNLYEIFHCISARYTDKQIRNLQYIFLYSAFKWSETSVTYFYFKSILKGKLIENPGEKADWSAEKMKEWHPIVSQSNFWKSYVKANIKLPTNSSISPNRFSSISKLVYLIGANTESYISTSTQIWLDF